MHTFNILQGEEPCHIPHLYSAILASTHQRIQARDQVQTSHPVHVGLQAKFIIEHESFHISALLLTAAPNRVASHLCRLLLQPLVLIMHRDNLA